MRETVKAYYGETLTSSADLKSDACWEISAPAPHIAAALKNIHPEVSARYYGCGLVAPEDLEGKTVLDLGCGTGRDVFLLAQLAGPDGRVIGVDMTEEQLAVAREHEAWHARRFGFKQANTLFLNGYIEALEGLDIAPGSVDVVVSNCVINLSIDKPAVFTGVRRLLKDDGVMHFADVYAETPVPEALRTDPVLYGECLAGALSWEEFVAAAREAGFATPDLLDHRPLAVTDPELLKRLNGLRFVSATTTLRPTSASRQSGYGPAPDPFADYAERTAAGGCCG